MLMLARFVGLVGAGHSRGEGALEPEINPLTVEVLCADQGGAEHGRVHAGGGGHGRANAGGGLLGMLSIGEAWERPAHHRRPDAAPCLADVSIPSVEPSRCARLEAGANANPCRGGSHDRK